MRSGQGRIRGKKGEWQMKGHRTRKIAPINMKKEAIQHVIDGYTVEEVLKQIPEGIKIIQANVKCFLATGKKRMVVPNKIKSYGVQSIWIGTEIKDVVFVFDKISKTALLNNVKEACIELGIDPKKAYFKYITLTNGEANGRFEHCTKEQTPDETDLRKKLRVLGLVSGTGKVQGLVADLHAKKFHCVIKEEPVKFVMCKRD